MAQQDLKHLSSLSTEQLRALLDGGPVLVLVPVGSVEPHGPHLPLGTDTAISQAVVERAVVRLAHDGHTALIAPAVPYGVTDYAAGFAGAISIPAEVLTAFLRAMIDAYLTGGFAHVCLVNNHLEPEHDAAIRAAVAKVDRASVACPLTRRWGRTLSDEYKSGACHAGRYETSLMLAAQPELVDEEAARALPALDISLSKGMQDGLHTFRDMGIGHAYTGAPAEASRDEGNEMLERLTTMVVTEVEEALARARVSS
jgi:creatinine amidohydrolase